MVRWLDSWDPPRLLLVALGLATAVALVVAASTSSAAFGVYNPAWDGAADLQGVARAEGVDAEVVRDVAAYDEVDPPRTVAIVLAPTETYTAAEAASLRRFLVAGGTLVVAEDFGPGANGLITRLGASSRIDPVPLRDERMFFRAPGLPVATEVGDDPLLAGVEEIVLNHPAAVTPDDAEVLVSTSAFAYADEDRDGALDADETLGSRAVITAEPIGDGTLIVAGDPSLFVNVMLERPGNRRFVGNLFARGELVLLDYSHAGALPPLAAAVLVLREVAWLQVLLGGLALVGVLAWQRGVVGGFADGPAAGDTANLPEASGEALHAFLRERHPNWEEERLRRVVAGLMTTREQGGPHD